MLYIFISSPTGEFIQTQKIEELKDALEKPGPHIWIDLENPTDEERNLLTDLFHFNPQAVEEVKQITGIPKITIYDQSLFLVMHRVFYDFEIEGCQKREFEIFCSEKFIVTTHSSDLSRTFASTREKVRENPKKLLGRGTSYVLIKLLDLMVKDYLPIIGEWQDKVDEIEDQVLRGSQEKILDQILQFKKLAVTLRKNLIPQREIISQLYEEVHLPFINVHVRAAFKTIIANMNALIHDLEGIREHAASVFEVYAAMLTIRMTESSHQLNFVMQRLTIAATIFMPLTFIVGVYGMNFESMPEFHWKGFYYILWGFMISLTAGMIYFFKRKKWI